MLNILHNLYTAYTCYSCILYCIFIMYENNVEWIETNENNLIPLAIFQVIVEIVIKKENGESGRVE